jgi:hypothetical protein
VPPAPPPSCAFVCLQRHAGCDVHIVNEEIVKLREAALDTQKKKEGIILYIKQHMYHSYVSSTIIRRMYRGKGQYVSLVTPRYSEHRNINKTDITIQRTLHHCDRPTH